MESLKKRLLPALGLLLIVVLSVSGTALAGTHFVIIADYLNSKNDPANFDVVALGPGNSVRYTVFQAAGNRVQTVALNNSFATSSDLFNLGGSPVVLPALVMATTIDGAGNPDGISSFAMLRQNKLIQNVPPFAGSGRAFAFPLGDLGNGAHMLVGNPGFFPLLSCSFTVNGLAQPSFDLDAFHVKDIPLTTAPAIIVLNISGPESGLVVALAIVGKGQDFALTLIPPFP